MKLRILTLVAATFVLVACKKENACTCASVTYVNGVYNGTSTEEYLVDSESKCKAYEKSTPEETISCAYAE